MKNSRFYLIESKSGVFDGIQEVSPDLFDLFTSKQIWEDVSEDYRGWSSLDYIAKAKLSFLLAMHADYSEEEYFSTFFPEFAFSQKYFDKYWGIIGVDIFENSEDRIKESSAVHQAVEQCDNDKVKEWLSSLEP
jgi:hypothetical protein